MTHEVIPYTPDLAPAVARFLRPLWDPDERRNAAYLAWKYERNPYGAPRIRLAVADGAVVGMRGLSGAAWIAGSSDPPAPLWHADDMLVAEPHRKSGAARAIVEALARDADRDGIGAVGLTPSPATALVSLAAGWRSLGGKQPLAIVAPRVAARRALRRRLARAPLLWRVASRAPVLRTPEERRPFGVLDRARRTGRNEDPRVDDVPRPAEMATLAESASADGRLRHRRDRAYLEWRLANPLAEYRFLYAAGARGLDGYLVLEHRRGSHDVGTVTVADWEAPDPRVRERLLRAAVDRGRFGDLAAWAGTLDADSRAMLDRAGFRPHERPAALGSYRALVLARVPPGTELPPLAGWDLRPLWAA